LGGLCFHFAALAERIQGDFAVKSVVDLEIPCAERKHLQKTNAAN